MNHETQKWKPNAVAGEIPQEHTQQKSRITEPWSNCHVGRTWSTPVSGRSIMGRGGGGRGQPTNTHDSSKIQLDTIFKDISKRQRGFKNASLSDAHNSQMYFETSYLIHSPLDPALRWLYFVTKGRKHATFFRRKSRRKRISHCNLVSFVILVPAYCHLSHFKNLKRSLIFKFIMLTKETCLYYVHKSFIPPS